MGSVTILKVTHGGDSQFGLGKPVSRELIVHSNFSKMNNQVHPQNHHRSHYIFCSEEDSDSPNPPHGM